MVGVPRDDWRGPFELTLTVSDGASGSIREIDAQVLGPHGKWPWRSWRSSSSSRTTPPSTQLSGRVEQAPSPPRRSLGAQATGMTGVFCPVNGIGNFRDFRTGKPPNGRKRPSSRENLKFLTDSRSP
jgi:hypothetical protein